MIKLSRMNESKNLGILYHFTPIKNLLKIINSNKLIANDCDDLVTGVSLTRNKNLNRGGCTWVRLSLDGTKLSNNHKIIPVNDQAEWEEQFHTDYDQRESEERVLSDIDNVKKYLISVDIHIRAINDPKTVNRVNRSLNRSGLNNIEELITFLDKNQINHGIYGKMSDRG